MITCGRLTPAFAFVTPLCKGKGRQVVLAKVGIMETKKPGEDIKWCAECGRYFDPKFPHECNASAILANRHSLERWLGRYKIKEES
jgi:hypothetical protein